MFKYALEIIVFACGAVVMVFEVLGSRILGPYFGTSMFVWTSLIGIILASLGLGYFLGGRIADRQANFRNLSMIIFLAGASIALATFIKDSWLLFLQKNIADVRVASVMAGLVLFFPTSFLLGIVSPYAVKLRIKDLDTSGRMVGDLYAISTLGSIVGTFLAGFYLIPQFGTNRLMVMLVIVLISVSLLTFFGKKKAYVLAGAFFLLLVVDDIDFVSGKDNFLDVDTAYNRIWIYDQKKTSKETGTTAVVRTMGINNENHSSMILGSTDLVNEYTKYYHLARHFNPDFQKTLSFGGAGYSFPKNFLDQYPRATIDVIEIDPGVTQLARKYFELKNSRRMGIYHEDGRVYLNRCKDKYDVIFGDAFSSRYSIPYQMTTLEAIRREYDILNNNGVVILNLISAIEGEKGKFLRAEYATYKKVFPQVYLFPVHRANDGNETQNIILVALKNNEVPSFTDEDKLLDGFLEHRWQNEIISDMPILTDDFAPVDYYINQAL